MKQLLGKFLPFLFLLLLSLILSLTVEDFATRTTLSIILRFTAVFIIMGVGMTFVIVSGGIDLSIGSVLAFSSIIVAWCAAAGWPLWLAFAVGVLTGTAWGALNGLLVVLLQLPPFVATLASFGMARGLATVLAKELSKGTSVDVPGNAFRWLADGVLFGEVPLPVVVMIAVVGIGYYVLNHTRLGRYSFAIGSNVDAARYSGIPVGRYKLLVYMLLGTLAGVAGMIEASINSGGQATLGKEYELRVIAAVVIGGGSLSGGVGTIFGTVTGALIMGVISTASILIGLQYEWELVVISVLIVVAVAFDMYQRRRSGA
jgi:ribose transport system permease protein